MKTGVLADCHRGSRNFDRMHRINCNRMDRMKGGRERGHRQPAVALRRAMAGALQKGLNVSKAEAGEKLFFAFLACRFWICA